MSRRILVLAIVCLAWPLLCARAATAQPATEQFKGTWTLVSIRYVSPDGSSIEPFGQNAKGMLVFDGARFATQVMAGNLPKFASHNRMVGTLRGVRSDFPWGGRVFRHLHCEGTRSYSHSSHRPQFVPKLGGNRPTEKVRVCGRRVAIHGRQLDGQPRKIRATCMEKSPLTDDPTLGESGQQGTMNTVQAARLFSSNTSERETLPIDLAVVCVWSFAGVLLTALALVLGLGVEIGQTLASAG